ncbi:aminoglycoside phosphotransferase family protein [Henriciella aquimarina]|uniref:aminoglycoside phosphotransferase family protein n=1 Tax=Henriciella aquimarina TaxID=545261 RepID=UPI000A03A237|nr:phosphotransferase [Henriciella aquimarina]
MGFDADRDFQIEAFLAREGWGDARLAWLGQDASTRRYGRLTRPSGETALLMDAPLVEDDPCTPALTDAERLAGGWNKQSRLAASRVEAFAAIGGWLKAHGFSAPEIYTGDPALGLAVIEDFGTLKEFARLIEQGADEMTLYTAAASALADLHAQERPAVLEGLGCEWPLLAFDDLALRVNSDLFADWLPRLDARMKMTDATRARWESERDALIDQARTFPRELTLRDYHAENLIWLPEREGRARIGLLDFQDAVIGWDAWDMAMLVQDARREVTPEAQAGAIRAYLERSGKAEEDFLERLSVIGTLNALRITGIFSRLIHRDGKDRYNLFLPRQKKLLARNLQHPAAAGMAAFVRDVAPFIFEEG